MTIIAEHPAPTGVPGARADQAAAAPRPVEEKIDRLSTASLRRVIEPDEAVTGTIGDGQVLPTELMSIAGLDLGLTDEQRAALSREEVASIAGTGVRFESILMGGFAIEILGRDFSDPRLTYVLHEIGEETRHSRLFIRMINQLSPKAHNPFDARLPRVLSQLAVPLLASMPAMFCVAVLTGEEIPDLLQKLASEHPDTDPFIRDVNKYHRQEEARHLAFARLLLPELWKKASVVDKFMVRHVAPRLAGGMFETIVHPGVYKVVGLPAWETWRAANRTPERLAMKHRALRPILNTLLDARAFERGGIPRAWRRECGVDASGNPA